MIVQSTLYNCTYSAYSLYIFDIMNVLTDILNVIAQKVCVKTITQSGTKT